MEARRNAIHVDFLKSDAGIKRHLALKKRGKTPSELPRQGSGSNHGTGWAQYCPGPNRPQQLFTVLSDLGKRHHSPTAERHDGDRSNGRTASARSLRVPSSVQARPFGGPIYCGYPAG